jgi:hypothetical protein
MDYCEFSVCPCCNFAQESEVAIKVAYINFSRKEDLTLGGQIIECENWKVPDLPDWPFLQKVLGWSEIVDMLPKIKVCTGFWKSGKDVHEGYNG